MTYNLEEQQRVAGELKAALAAAVVDEWVSELERKGIASLIDEAVAAERECCAQVADGYPAILMARVGSSLDSACRGIAAAIRARKEKP